MKRTIGEKLRTVRERLGLDIPTVSERSGTSAGEIQIIEAGLVAPSPGELRGLARVYNVDFIKLMILAGHMTRRDVTRYQERQAA